MIRAGFGTTQVQARRLTFLPIKNFLDCLFARMFACLVGHFDDCCLKFARGSLRTVRARPWRNLSFWLSIDLEAVEPIRRSITSTYPPTGIPRHKSRKHLQLLETTLPVSTDTEPSWKSRPSKRGPSLIWAVEAVTRPTNGSL